MDVRMKAREYAETKKTTRYFIDANGVNAKEKFEFTRNELQIYADKYAGEQRENCQQAQMDGKQARDAQQPDALPDEFYA